MFQSLSRKIYFVQWTADINKINKEEEKKIQLCPWNKIIINKAEKQQQQQQPQQQEGET